MSRVSPADYAAHQAFVNDVLGEVSRRRLTIRGPAAEAVHSDRDDALPLSSVLVTTPAGDELLIVRTDLREDQDAAAVVRAWLVQTMPLRGARLVSGRHRLDPVWVSLWRQAN